MGGDPSGQRPGVSMDLQRRLSEVLGDNRAAEFDAREMGRFPMRNLYRGPIVPPNSEDYPAPPINQPRRS